jgi:hypothetical protein
MWIIEGKVTQVSADAANEGIGDAILEGVRIKITWEPTRYPGPQQTVTAPAAFEVRSGGPVSIDLTYYFPQTRCTGSAPGIWEDIAPGRRPATVKVSPGQEPILTTTQYQYVFPLVGPGPTFKQDNFVDLQCVSRGRRQKRTFALDLICAFDGAVGLTLKQGELNLTCRDANHVHRLTGMMKVDKP